MQLFEGIQLIQLKNFPDNRGSFRECYKKPLYIERGITAEFVQDNHSVSKKGVIRGMHFQGNQAKLLTVIVGTILDVFVDLRPGSETFGKWQGILLDAEKSEQLYLPGGFAHGFAVLSETAHLFYKVSEIYNPQEERTLRYDDPEVGIEWPILDPIVSDRDRAAPSLKELNLGTR